MDLIWSYWQGAGFLFMDPLKQSSLSLGIGDHWLETFPPKHLFCKGIHIFICLCFAAVWWMQQLDISICAFVIFLSCPGRALLPSAVWNEQCWACDMFFLRGNLPHSLLPVPSPIPWICEFGPSERLGLGYPSAWSRDLPPSATCRTAGQTGSWCKSAQLYSPMSQSAIISLNEELRDH